MFGSSLFIATSWEPDCKEFLSAMGIRLGGFGAQLFVDLYEGLFERSLDLKKEYDRYYTVEYQSLSVFIESWYDKTLSDHELTKEHIYYVKRVPDIVDMNYDDNLLSHVLACVEKMDVDHEDQT